MKSEIPPEQRERAQARVDELLGRLRRETQSLPPDADCALAFLPELEPQE